MTSTGPADYASLLKGEAGGYRLVHSRGLTKENEFKPGPNKSFAIVMVEGQHPRLLPELLKGNRYKNGEVAVDRHRTFVYLPHPEHAKAFDAMDAQKQTIQGSAGHLSVYLDKKTMRAMVTQLQSNASPASGESYDEHEAVRGKHASCTRQLIEAAKEQLAREGYALHFFHPYIYVRANKPEVTENAKTEREAKLINDGIKGSYERAINGSNAEAAGTTGDMEHAFGIKAHLDRPLFEVSRRAYRIR